MTQSSSNESGTDSYNDSSGPYLDPDYESFEHSSLESRPEESRKETTYRDMPPSSDHNAYGKDVASSE